MLLERAGAVKRKCTEAALREKMAALIAEEQLDADIIVTAYAKVVKARIHDVFPVSGTCHESLVNIARGVDTLCQVFACGDFEPSSLDGNTLVDRGPDWISSGFRVLVLKIAPAHHSPGAHDGLCSQAGVPSQPRVSVSCQFIELNCSFIRGGTRTRDLPALGIYGKRPGLLGKRRTGRRAKE